MTTKERLEKTLGLLKEIQALWDVAMPKEDILSSEAFLIGLGMVGVGHDQLEKVLGVILVREGEKAKEGRA